MRRVHVVRVRGGNFKYRALRLDIGNFAWGSEGNYNLSALYNIRNQKFTFHCVSAVARKTRILDVVYNASNNELVRTKTLVKNAIVQIDATPFRQWFEAHYLTQLGTIYICCSICKYFMLF